MCNDFGNHIPYSDYLAAFSQTRIPVRWPKAAPNLEPREDIWPTDKAPVIRRLEDGTNEFVQFCRVLGAQPYMAANLRSLPAEEFYRWVEYCNSPAGSTTLADERAASGHLLDDVGLRVVEAAGVADHDVLRAHSHRLQEIELT